MGQKIHPVGLRLGITRTWDSRWFEKKNYRTWLQEDRSIRKYFGRLTRAAAISKIEIERRANQARIVVHTAKPGIIIGKRGVGIEDIRKSLEVLTQKNVQVNVVEIKHPELDARLVGQNIVDQLEKRIAFRRAMKQAIMRTMKAGARGVKVMVSGRLGGAEIARSEQNHDGKVPLHTLRADIDYAHVEAFTTFGRIGCKVWIYKGEVLPDAPRAEPKSERTGERATFRDRRNERRTRRPPEERAPAAETVEAETIALPPVGAIEHDHSSLAEDIEGAPPAGGEHPTGVHSGSVLHSVPHPAIEAVEDSTPIEGIEHSPSAVIFGRPDELEAAPPEQFGAPPPVEPQPEAASPVQLEVAPQAEPEAHHPSGEVIE